MLPEKKIELLIFRISRVFNNYVLTDISPEGYILAADQNGNVYPDNVTTHHLVEFCLELDPKLTNRIIEKAVSWFLEKQNDASNPFFITTILNADIVKKQDKIDICNNILTKQRNSGFIDLYAGFLDGGNIFSTLWAIKILILSDLEKNKECIHKAFKAIDNNWKDIHRTSFKGFYLELLLKFGDENGLINTSDTVFQQILSEQDESGTWDECNLYTAYVLGNICTKDISDSQRTSATTAIMHMFDLNNDEIEIPNFFLNSKEKYVDSAFIQICIRSLVSAIKYLRIYYEKDAAREIASNVFGLFPMVYHAAKVLDSEKKKMIQQYGQIREHFDHLEKAATEIILSESVYEKNVFIMMPFRHDVDERYESIVEVIKSEFSKYNFKAWLASDKTIKPHLWDNVASFMLACKYGVAVFTRVEEQQRIRVDEFNPNVSLELGFFMSRGKKVLLLKDNALPRLPSDLVGHLYQGIELNRVKRQLPEIIKNWVEGIVEHESLELAENSKNV